MIQNFDELLKRAMDRGPVTVSVAAAQDKEVLEAIKEAKKLGLINAILVGDKEKIEALMSLIRFDETIRIIDEKDTDVAALIAAELVRNGEAQVLMKGILNSGNFLKAALHVEKGLRSGRILSHFAAFEIPGEAKLVFHTDGGMNIAPTVEQKKEILTSAIEAVQALGVEVPKVALLAANEVVNEKMPVTLECKTLSDMGANGQLPESVIEGPIAMDVAASKEAAAHKGIESKISGEVDIFMVPTIEVGNAVGKTLVYYAKAKIAGLILGATHPIVMVSRADNAQAKLNSIALACLLSKSI